MKIKVFNYYEELDAFLCTPEYKYIAHSLQISEWNPVVWIGRLFARDQDFGEHFFDNWDEREELNKKLKNKEIQFQFPDDNEDWSQLLIIVPARFTEQPVNCIKCSKQHEEIKCPTCDYKIRIRPDGPCHSNEFKKKFWTDVLKSLELDIETLFYLARETNNDFIDDEYEEKIDIEERIKSVKQFLQRGKQND